MVILRILCSLEFSVKSKHTSGSTIYKSINICLNVNRIIYLTYTYLFPIKVPESYNAALKRMGIAGVL